MAQYIWAILATPDEIGRARFGPLRPYHWSYIHETLYGMNQGDERNILVPHLPP